MVMTMDYQKRVVVGKPDLAGGFEEWCACYPDSLYHWELAHLVNCRRNSVIRVAVIGNYVSDSLAGYALPPLVEQ